MTTYTAIPDSDIDPESPGTTTLFTRLRDNPLAIAEGDATAPGIAFSALSSAVVTSGTYEVATGATEQTNSLSYIKAVEWIVGMTGTINVYFGLHISSTAAYARIYKNGSPIGIERVTTSATPVYYSEDITISDGDKIQIYLKTGNTLYTSYLTGATMRCAATIPGSAVRTV